MRYDPDGYPGYTAGDEDETAEGEICSNCNGSGEGQYDGTTCDSCKGKGEC